MLAWTRLSVRSAGGLELAEARFGSFVKAARLKHVCGFAGVARFQGFSVKKCVCSEHPGALEWAECSFGGLVRAPGLKDFLFRRVSVRSVWGLELAKASCGGFARAPGLKDLLFRSV